jgi:predicted methyltransferase
VSRRIRVVAAVLIAIAGVTSPGCDRRSSPSPAASAPASAPAGTRAEFPPPPPDWFATAVVEEKDREPADVALDAERKPVPMIMFFGVRPKMRVGELGAEGGYTTELLARSVGRHGGEVFAQDSPAGEAAGLGRIWEARLSKRILRTTTHFFRPWQDPFPPEVKDLDGVYAVMVYHDVLAEKKDTAKMNRAVFAVLKSGGTYAIIDNSAKPGTGAADVARLHRVDEQLVREQVERAGFRFDSTSDFLRNPTDTRDWNADPRANLPESNTQDRFALKFVKP